MMSVSFVAAVLQGGVDPGQLTHIPPAVAFIVTAIIVAIVGRRVGHGLAVVTGIGVAIWLYAVPTGVYLPVEFLGFNAVLFRVDGISKLLGVTFGVITAITALYAFGSGRNSTQTALALAYAGTATGVVFAGDWLTLVVFWEVMSVVSAILLWSSGGAAVRAGFRYAVFHAFGGVFLLGAVALQYIQIDSFLFSEAVGIAPGVPAALAVVGIGVNAGFVGVHTWIPDAYPKPHFVTSVILCGYTTKVAVYTLHRAFPEGNLLIVYAGVAMTVFGVTYALVQTNMRRLLSYHIQSQVGYMVAGVGIGTTIGIAGGFAHLVNNILYKSLLFMVAGVILYRTGGEDLKKVGGLYRSMPLTFFVFVAAAFAIAGVPGFNGFVSKEIVKSGLKKEQLTTLKWLLTIAGIGTTMSFVKFGYYAFFHGESNRDVRDATSTQTVSMIGIAVLCVLIGVNPSVVLEFLPGGASVSDAVTSYAMSTVFEAVVFISLGVVGFFFIRTRLAQIRSFPDFDTIYNPVAFYGLRSVVDGFETISSGLKHQMRVLTHAVSELGTAVDPVSHVTDKRVTLPPHFGIDYSVLFLVLLAVLLLVSLLV